MADEAAEATNDESLGYTDALGELDAILTDLEDDDIDIDVLATKVQRAAALIRICRGRIDAAKVEVQKIVTELDEPVET
ncbi:MAG: exodeoxyribonuclease VII small subunit [Acidimicrobiales bacterium]|nr:exodeoxyribonuclease VII small subunit [Acidimicrobiales bacterium]